MERIISKSLCSLVGMVVALGFVFAIVELYGIEIPHADRLTIGTLLALLATTNAAVATFFDEISGRIIKKRAVCKTLKSIRDDFKSHENKPIPFDAISSYLRSLDLNLSLKTFSVTSSKVLEVLDRLEKLRPTKEGQVKNYSLLSGPDGVDDLMKSLLDLMSYYSRRV